MFLSGKTKNEGNVWKLLLSEWWTQVVYFYEFSCFDIIFPQRDILGEYLQRSLLFTLLWWNVKQDLFCVVTSLTATVLGGKDKKIAHSSQFPTYEGASVSENQPNSSIFLDECGKSSKYCLEWWFFGCRLLLLLLYINFFRMFVLSFLTLWHWFWHFDIRLSFGFNIMTVGVFTLITWFFHMHVSFRACLFFLTKLFNPTIISRIFRSIIFLTCCFYSSIYYISGNLTYVTVNKDKQNSRK